jgi:hypothetical protein
MIDMFLSPDNNGRNIGVEEMKREIARKVK